MGNLERYQSLVADFMPWRGEVPKGFLVNFVGALTDAKFRLDFEVTDPDAVGGAYCETALPTIGGGGNAEGWFEAVNWFAAALEARGRYVMMSLGACYGGQAVSAYRVLQAINPMPCQLVLVEPEPENCRWIAKHLSDNGIDPRDHWLVPLALNDRIDPVLFPVGSPGTGAQNCYATNNPSSRKIYADIIVRSGKAEETVRNLFQNNSTGIALNLVEGRNFNAEIKVVSAITLAELLGPFDLVDFIECDIQQSESQVFPPFMDLLTRKVRRIHIGTHGADVHEDLRRCFAEAGWQIVFSFKPNSTNKTRVGSFTLNDGILTVVNPSLTRPWTRKRSLPEAVPTPVEAAAPPPGAPPPGMPSPVEASSEETDRADRAARTFEDFRARYLVQDYEGAVGLFVDGLERDPAWTYRHFLAQGSGLLADALSMTGKASAIAERLEGSLARHPGINIACENSPSRLQAVIARREANINKGLPSIVLVTQGKSASVSVANIFNSGFRLPSVAYSLIQLRVIEEWARDYARGGACYTTHLRPSPENIEKLKRAGIDRLIVHVRDPRQAFLSRIHHFERYPDQLVAFGALVSSAESLEAKFEAARPLYERSIEWIEGWLAASKEMTILFSTFEDFMEDREAFVERYLAFYGADTRHFNRGNAFGVHAGIDNHFRKGETDEWRRVFSAEESKRLTGSIPAQMMERFGWVE